MAIFHCYVSSPEGISVFLVSRRPVHVHPVPGVPFGCPVHEDLWILSQVFHSKSFRGIFFDETLELSRIVTWAIE